MVTDSPNAWALATFGEERAYAGNVGYSDEVESAYRYDSFVQNWKQLAVGDIVVLRDDAAVIGSARVARIDAAPGQKEQRRCPQPGCGTTSIKIRATKEPAYRCNKGHVFDDPLVTLAECTNLTARFDGSFVSPDAAVSVLDLSGALARGNQVSIRRLDLARLPTPVATRLRIASILDGSPSAAPNVFRLNVAASRLAACVEHRRFAIAGTRKAMQPGDILLLQLNKEDADRLGESDSRIRHALVYESMEPDPDGSISKRHWPDFEPRSDTHVVHCSAVLPVQPFSFMVPPFEKDYWSAQNAIKLTDADAALALAYVEAGGIDPRAPLEEDEGDPQLSGNPQLRRKIEKYAVRRVIAILEERYPAPTYRVVEMPRNNKGFDIEVLNGVVPVLFVEVKGTQRPFPRFWMSEAERLFSVAEAVNYELHVVWGIDIDSALDRGVELRIGAVEEASHHITTFTWTGRLDVTLQ